MTLLMLGQCNQARIFGYSVLMLALLPIQWVYSQEIAFTDLYIFGQSLSDTGNYHALYGSPVVPYFDARFSNGPVTVDYLADGLNLPRPVPSLRGGKNYAYSAAATGPGDNLVTPIGVVFDPPRTVPNFGTQIEEFLASGSQLGPRDLIYIDSPTNDVLSGVSPSEIENNISDHVQTLYDAGGRYFVLNNSALPDIASARANDAIERSVSKLVSDFQDINIGIVYSDAIVNDIFADPLKYGFPNAFGSACTNCEGLVIQDGPFDIAADPNTYVIWDSIHPTTRFHEIVAEETLRVAYAMVPESIPSGIVVAALIGIVGRSRHKRIVVPLPADRPERHDK